MFKRKKEENTIIAPLTIVEGAKKELKLEEDEELLGIIPAYCGVRDFDPSHSFSCSSMRDKVAQWRIGAFINTTRYLMFRQIEEDLSFTTIFRVLLEKIYEVEVGIGAMGKQLELCTEEGSFEVRFEGTEPDFVYRIRELLINLLHLEEQPTVVTCEYCSVRQYDASFCIHCGAPLRKN